MDGTGASARFSQLSGIATDGAGNLFVTQADQQTIRKIVIATGAVTTFAGAVGQADSLDGTGTAARFSYPRGLVSDGAGNLFVTEAAHGIRKIATATGAVTTVVAGHAASPEETVTSSPVIASDGAGNLYIDDQYVIQKVVIATGAVTSLLDAAGAPFNTSAPLAADGAGSLFLGDDGATIRKIAIATGAVTTLAGAPAQPGTADGTGAIARFRSACGVATDGAGNAYVADGQSDTVRKIVIGTKAVTTFAGAPGQPGADDGIGANARFYGPTSILGDGAGNLFVAAGAIRRIAIASATVSTLTNGPGRDLDQPGPAGIASDGSGNLYFADAGTAIWKIAVATGALSAIAGAPGVYGSADGTGTTARFTYPAGIVGDEAGNLYVVDSGNNTIRKIAVATKVVTTFAGRAGEYGSADGVGANALFSSPSDIASDGAGNLYVADTGNHTIRRIAIDTGTVSTVIGSLGSVGVAIGAFPASLSGPCGVVVLPTGELGIADAGENAILIAHL